MTIEQIVYDSTFDKTLKNLKLRSMDPDFTIETLEGELSSLYVYEELDWTGRGEIKSSELGGASLAYQVFIHEWKKRESQGQKS